MDFSSDKKTWDINNEYLFGKSFLVVPILNPQYTPEKFIKTDENEGWNKTDAKKRKFTFQYRFYPK
jgi:alpha-D-xyloside xylohydrolase